MLNIIHLLPSSVANQIAAGEVVQRPSSVVKELVENAVDAGSTHIKLITKQGGAKLIQVIDNGVGMSQTDARMCFERHATSKIQTAEDLLALSTLGFRGEALASIAAVAQVELITREAKTSLGTHVTIAGSVIKNQMPINVPTGTQISVKNLFFNVPARRNFLKSDVVENKHIMDEFQRVALVRPEISFSFYQNNTELYHLPATKLSQRILHLFGKGYQKKMVPCKEANPSVQLEGYIGDPRQAKRTRGEQFFFVNKRYVKSAYLHHAVKKAFEGLIAPNSFPFYVLFITIPTEQVDINVHPTKTEVKFQHDQMVYITINAAIKKTLGMHHLTPSLDFEQNINSTPFQFTQKSDQARPTTLQERDYASLKGIVDTSHASDPDATPDPQVDPGLKLPSKANHASNIPAMDAAKGKLQLHKKYIIAQVRSGMLVVDRRAAQERIIYEKILKQLKKPATATQQLLFPKQVVLNSSDFALLKTYKQTLQSLGFQLEFTDPSTVTIMGMPPIASKQNSQDFLEALLEQYKWCAQTSLVEHTESWARAMAKRACLPHDTLLTDTEIDNITDQLFACENCNFSPDGAPIWFILSLDKLAALLKDSSHVL